MMRRIFLLLTMIVATAVSAMAQEEFNGQLITINLASGKSMIGDMESGIPQPRLVNGKIVWQAAGEDIENIVFVKPEESMAAARQALIDFYNATDGDHWSNNTNWCTDKPIGEWFGVYTDGYPYVNRLMLNNNNIKGEIPQTNFFSKIGPLWNLDLSENEISGSIPAEMANNLNLALVSLFSNQLSGELSEDIFKLPSISYFSASNNHLTGTIPAGIARLMDNSQVDIYNNDFSGDVPQEVLSHPKFHLNWDCIVPQGGHLNVPTIPGYQLPVSDVNGNTLNTTDVYNGNFYTLIFNYSSAKGEFTDKLKKAYETYKSKGFEVLGMAPGEAEAVNEYLHANNIAWLNLDPKSFGDAIGRYYTYLNFINLVDQKGNVVFSSIMDETGKMEDTWGSSTRDQMVFDVLADKFGQVDFTPYSSTDYSRDGEVIALQKASVGKGVDIVFVGNCFVDKDMAPDGLYERKMKEAMEQFFAYEPYTSLRNRFNVYAVKAVSQNAEMYEGCKQAINSDADAFNYAKKVTTLIADRPLRVNIIYNSYNAGRPITFMYDDNSYVAYMTNGVNRILNHEAGGHGIGRLYDEYVEDNGSTAPSDVKEYYEKMYADFGRGANIDMNADVTKTRWARLAADERYAAENLGAYEGSGTYQYGIYRPTNGSMMRFNDMPFNAPSREAIYKFVMQESEGNDWQYDYETFVGFDEKGREQYAAEMIIAASRAAKKDKESVTVDVRQQALPPVTIHSTWQEALENPTKCIFK